ncbi:tRNA threonylcarbamoyladenosine biosynthesis protein TsaB [Azospirillaceae bacterium]
MFRDGSFLMIVLGLDASGERCSVGLRCGGATVARRSRILRYGHAEALVPMIVEVLAEGAVDFAAVDVWAVTVGPGAFTGLRVGLATARGLALATGRPIFGVTTFEAVAAARAEDVEPRASSSRALLVAIESRREDVFLQRFSIDGTPETLPTALPPAEVVSLLPLGEVWIAGDGAARLRPILADRVGVHFCEGDQSIDAEVVARIGAERLLSTGAPPVPLYLRPPDVCLPGRK